MACIDNLWSQEEFYTHDGYESSSDEADNSSDANLKVDVIVQEMESILQRTRAITHLQRLNNIDLDHVLAEGYLPFLCDNVTVGIVSPGVVTVLRQFPGIFTINTSSITFHDNLDTMMARSGALNSVLMELSIR